jgi:hypothetical protein
LRCPPVEHGVTGYIVPDRTPESFVPPIIELLGNEARRRAMGRAGMTAAGASSIWM